MTEYNPEAPIHLKFSNKEIELHIERTTAYVHRQLGHKAINHLWITDTDERGEEYGFYMWYDQFGANDNERDENFKQTVQAMIGYGYLAILNIKEPSDTDVEQYVESQMRELNE